MKISENGDLGGGANLMDSCVIGEAAGEEGTEEIKIQQMQKSIMGGLFHFKVRWVWK